MNELDQKNDSTKPSVAYLSKKDLLLLGGALVLPFFSWVVLAHADRWFFGDSLDNDLWFCIFWTVVLVPGELSLWFSSLSWKLKLIILIIYIPCMGYLVFIFGLLFAGFVYDEWL